MQSNMDRRSWPWKKKSSDKSAAEKVIATLDSVAGASSASGGSHPDKVASCWIAVYFIFTFRCSTRIRYVF